MKEQLRDVLVSVASVAKTDEGNTYAETQVYRYDLESPIEDFIKYLEAYKGLIEGSQMKNI